MFAVWEDEGVIAIWMYESDPIRISVGTDNRSTESAPSDTLSLPQTGQLWWPVPLLIAVGVPFFLIGVLLFVRKEESEKFEEPYE